MIAKGVFFRYGCIGLLLATGAFAEPPSRQFSLFADHKSHHLDDVITIIVDEQSAATNQASTKTKTESHTKAHSEKGKGALEIIPSANSSTDEDARFGGDGQTGRKGKMNATVTARVIGILSNGNLEVEGSKEVTINEENEVLKVSGIVRPDDISIDNSVKSSRMANAKITYSGEGSVSSAMEKGFVARFFDWLF